MDDVYTNPDKYDSKSIPPVVAVFDYIAIIIGLPLALLTIVAVFFLARKDHGAPVYIINLLISDLIQLCCKVAWRIIKEDIIIYYIYIFGLVASIGFMVCISLERYLVVTKPLWHRFRRDIKVSLGVCVVVWTLALVFVLLVHFNDSFQLFAIMSAAILLLPLLLFTFFLVGTLKTLSAAHSVPDDEKRRIVAILVAVLLIYTLLFFPRMIWSLVEETRNENFYNLAVICLDLSPLADLTLYLFIRKGAIDNLLKSLCCKMSNRQETENTNNEVISGSWTEAV